jgi:hypothetical protein
MMMVASTSLVPLHRTKHPLYAGPTRFLTSPPFRNRKHYTLSGANVNIWPYGMAITYIF